MGDTSLPEEQPDAMSEEQLKALHHVLMEVSPSDDPIIGPAEGSAEGELTESQMHVEEGSMTCRGCGHIYPISNGIPNMVSPNPSPDLITRNNEETRSRLVPALSGTRSGAVRPRRSDGPGFSENVRSSLCFGAVILLFGRREARMLYAYT